MAAKIQNQLSRKSTRDPWLAPAESSGRFGRASGRPAYWKRFRRATRMAQLDERRSSVGICTAKDQGRVPALRLAPRRADQIVPRRELAGGVGGGGIAGKLEGLTAAAAEIARALGTAAARLGHPGFAAEGVHARRVGPALRQRALLHVS